MMSKKTSSKKIDEALGKSVNFELTIADIARRSERRAWCVTGATVVMALILAGGYFYMLPLKEKVPYIVMADAYTGTSTVARLTDDFRNRQISASEAINRSNVAHFIMARESYDVALMNLRDWVTVLTMSSPETAAAYRALHAPNNPQAPYNVYGRDKAIRIKILSIVPIGGGQGKTPSGATVRFQRSLYDKKSGLSQPIDNKIATMKFVYKSNLQMDERYRIENPLGFQVAEYRVDNDYASAAPAEIPIAASPAQAPASATSAADVDTVQPDLAAPPPSIEQGDRTTAPRTPAHGAGRR
jgi:type IV secretion system protein VirB8